MGGGGGVMTGRGAATALSKVTWAIGIAFVATSLALTVLAAHGTPLGLGRSTGSTVPRRRRPPPAPAAPAPGLEGDLLPTLPADEVPAAPPPAE